MFKVSVIIPVYNREEYVAASIRSVLDLEEVGEIIIIDDGSTDKSGIICKEMASIYNKLLYYTHENNMNKGVSASRNLGILKANNEYVAFLDSDDIYLENRFWSSARLFDRYKAIDAVYDPYVIEEKNGKLSQVHGINKSIKKDKLLLYAIKGGGRNFFCTNTITIRKKIFDKIGLFDTRLKIHEDSELWLRLIYYGNVIGDNYKNPVSIIKKHEGNSSNYKNYSTKKLYKEIKLKYYYNKDIGAKAKYYILKSYIYNEYKYNGIINTIKLLYKSRKYIYNIWTSLVSG